MFLASRAKPQKSAQPAKVDHLASVVIALSVATSACGGGAGAADLSNRVAQLRTEQQQRQAQLDQIERNIDAAKADQVRAECRASVAQMQAQVTIAKAQCIAARAEQAKCLAEGEGHATGGGLAGCLLGIGAGVLTGGVAIPATVALCGAGYALGKATATKCGEGPTCTPDEAILWVAVLSERHLSAPPQCP